MQRIEGVKKVRTTTILIILTLILSTIVFAACTNIPTGKAIETNEVNKMRTTVVFETTMGNFEIELNKSAAPITVENFLGYVNEGYYDGTVFHRVIPDFMVQGGGFTPDGKQKETKAPIKLESNNGLKNNKGSVAMARTNVPDSATSQFFVNVKDNDFLNYAPGNDGYAVFGKVVRGMNVVEEIEAVSTGVKHGMQDWPDEEVIINKAYVKEQ